MTGKKRFLLTALALALCLPLTACFGDGDGGGKRQGVPALPVGIFTVTARDTPWPAEFQARASGSRAVEVRARVQGIIEKRLYEEGSFVKAGQLLFRLSQVPLRTRHDRNPHRKTAGILPLRYACFLAAFSG